MNPGPAQQASETATISRDLLAIILDRLENLSTDLRVLGSELTLRTAKEEAAQLRAAMNAGGLPDSIIENETGVGEATFIIQGFINCLQHRRDWLDPDVENAARAYLAKHQPE